MPPAIRLQLRDTCLLTELGTVGLLDTRTLWARHFPSDRTGEACLRRLRLYAAHGLTETIAPAVSFGLPRGGRLPSIHRLTPRGAEVLTHLTGERLPRVLRGSPRPETLLHRLGCAKLQLLVLDACAYSRLPAPQWIAEYDARPGVRLKASFSERFVLCRTYGAAGGKKHTCWPDAATLFTFPAQAAGTPSAHPLVVLWEYDRSTETLAQFAKKVPGYRELLARDDWKAIFPSAANATVRVFVVTPSNERLSHVANTIRTLSGSEAFRLAVVGDLTSASFFTAALWRTVQGECRPILRHAPSA